MKFLMSCVGCSMTAVHARELTSYIELRDDAYDEVECTQRHRGSAILFGTRRCGGKRRVHRMAFSTLT